MMKSVAGIYRDGKVVLLERPEGLEEGRVIVTFLPATKEHNDRPCLTGEQIAELRGQLASWEEDWNAPGMERYDEL